MPDKELPLRATVIWFTGLSGAGKTTLATTESVRDLLLAQTPLKLKQSEGDVQYSGALVGYDVQPVSIQANATAALNRLTMTVKITYVSTLDAKKNKEFSVARFADYDSSQDITAVEEQLARDIGKQLAQDIFDRTLGDW